MINSPDNGVTRRIRGHFRVLYSSPVRWALLGMLLLAWVGTARADSFDNFLLTDGTQTMTWTLPSSPTPGSYISGLSFHLTGVIVLENGITPITTTTMGFFNQTGIADGGFGANFGNLIAVYDYQVYSGQESAPTFIPGTYSEPATDDDAANISLFHCAPGTVEADNGCGMGDTWALSTSNDVPLTLTITPAPEPSGILLLGSGLVGLMGMGLLRKRLV